VDCGGQSDRQIYHGPVTNDDPPNSPFGYVFAVADRPFCCWEHDHIDRTLAYLRGIDADYFESIAVMLAQHLEADESLAASMALRATYQQGIEALLSLLGAMVQAPSSVQSWIAKCSPADLPEVTRRLAAGTPLLTQEGRRSVTFEELSERVFHCAWRDDEARDATIQHFSGLWRRFANDFLDGTARAEYNAIKHGNRVSPGGFTMALGIEHSFGVPPPAEEMRAVGGSRYGSTFYEPEAVGASSRHFRSRRVSVNWSADAMVHRLRLVSMSISNIVAAVQTELQVDPRTLQFTRPIEGAAFTDAWRPEAMVNESNMDLIVRISPEDERSPAELVAILEQRAEDLPDRFEQTAEGRYAGRRLFKASTSRSTAAPG